MTTFLVNSAIYDKIYVGTTGLVGGNFTVTLERDGTATAELVTIVEDALGWYEFNFVPLVTGQYLIKISVGDFSYTTEWTVTSMGSSDHQALVEIFQKFFVGVDGLLEDDFVVLLERNNASPIPSVSFTITDDGGGWYNFSFTPHTSGMWIARIDYLDSHIKISAYVDATCSAGGGADNLVVTIEEVESFSVVVEELEDISVTITELG